LIELITNGQVEFPPEVNLSPLAKDFCLRLLRKSSEQRLTAEEAFKHPFIFVKK